jgi:hypothetical protein
VVVVVVVVALLKDVVSARVTGVVDKMAVTSLEEDRVAINLAAEAKEAMPMRPKGATTEFRLSFLQQRRD